jgi:SAM-dependent methyltransferase
MHKEVHKHIRRVRREHPMKFFRSRVMEVGSQIINGSPRKHFIRCRYTGIDLAPGLGVNRVHDASQPFTFLGQFDVVISVEVLEHAKGWWAILNNMYNALKPGGLMIVTCAGPARPEHGTKRTDEGSSPFTTDYYRSISTKDIAWALPGEGFSKYHLEYRREEQDLWFYGIKK